MPPRITCGTDLGTLCDLSCGAGWEGRGGEGGGGRRFTRFGRGRSNAPEQLNAFIPGITFLETNYLELEQEGFWGSKEVNSHHAASGTSSAFVLSGRRSQEGGGGGSKTVTGMRVETSKYIPW